MSVSDPTQVFVLVLGAAVLLVLLAALCAIAAAKLFTVIYDWLKVRERELVEDIDLNAPLLGLWFIINLVVAAATVWLKEYFL